MAVKSHDLDAQGQVTARRGRGDLAAGLLALVFGLAFWAVGGKYTLDGWIVGLNVLLGFLQVPVRIPRAVEWWVLLFIPLALAYSWVEVMARPGRPTSKGWRRWLVAFLLWLIVIATDIGSTFIGVQNPGVRPWLVSTWLAETDIAGGLWSIVLTFFPEALILYGIKQLR